MREEGKERGVKMWVKRIRLTVKCRGKYQMESRRKARMFQREGDKSRTQYENTKLCIIEGHFRHLYTLFKFDSLV